MNKFIPALLLVAIAASSVTAFTTTQGASRTAARRQTASTPFGPSFEVPSAAASTTALQLKVDPNKIKGNKNTTGNAKMAAYGGSVAIAALLPIAFLIWSAISK